jgi:hypothetical protein
MIQTTQPPSSDGFRRVLAFLLVVGIVFISRFLTRGSVYFIDGPALVKAIQVRTYVIQSPGYWLFARTAGLFPNPEFGLIFINELSSAVGGGIFFLLCLELELPFSLALLAALAYSSIFFAWFAGDVHSSYATQLLFPALAAWLLIRYRKTGFRWLLLCGAASLAIGTGMRPSDGVFLLPLFVAFLLHSVKNWKRRILAAVVFAVICLGWYYPTKLASHLANQTVHGELAPIAASSSLLLGASVSHALANATRLFLPLIVACWMLIPAWMSARPRAATIPLVLWFAPGFVFYLLVFIANPTYIVFALPSLILLAALIDKRQLAIASLSICLIWNSVFFLAARPIRSDSVFVLPFDYYAIMYTNYGIQHQWNKKIENGARIP